MVKHAWLALAFGLAASPASAALKPGDPAPTFQVEAAKGGKTFDFDLASALKKGPVVLYFYPKSFTSTCTVEAHEFADNMPNFKAAGASVLGISGDAIDTQKEFSAKECRDTFPVGADPDFTVIKAYDASFAGMFAKRISYVIAPDGTVLEAHEDSEADSHIETALAAVRQWQAAHRK